MTRPYLQPASAGEAFICDSTTMARHVALLRGINVGGHNRLPMAALRTLLADLGYAGVRTHLQSGNAVLTTDVEPDTVARQVEEKITAELGLAVRVLVRSRDELARIVADNPLPDTATEPPRFLVTFLSAAPDREVLADLDPGDFTPDVFVAGEREIYVWCPRGVQATKLSHTFWEKRLRVTATARNWNTVTKLLELTDA